MRKIVIKVGTSALTEGTQKLSRRFMLGLVQQISLLHQRGIQPILVTSGAVATGKDLLKTEFPCKQMLASIGQAKLIQVWAELFAFFDLQVGQVLFTKEDFTLEKQSLTRNTLESLLYHGIIPIINENDTVSAKGLGVGNNDKLAALITETLSAEMMILLTDQEGLYTADPRHNPDAQLIPFVSAIDETIYALAKGSSTSLGTGGMAAKIEAAQIAAAIGARTVIASSSRSNILIDLIEGKKIGTLFAPSLKAMASIAKKNSFEMAKATSAQKNEALHTLSLLLKQEQETILRANGQDIALAKNLSAHLLERLSLEHRLAGIIHDIEQVISLPDPVGKVFDEQILPNQLQLSKCRTPLGVLGVIYESRPNVTIDISALAIKSGNCAILRGGSETLHTNQVLIDLIQRALQKASLPERAIQLIANPDRSEVEKLLGLDESIDLIIPRGSASLQKFCREKSKIPVITGGVGICHMFIDETADLDRALPVILNAKTQRPTVCNALDTLLVHSAIAAIFIPQLIDLLTQKGVAVRLDSKAHRHAPTHPLAQPSDWDTEWLSLVLGIKVVENIEEAIAHIQQHSTGHSEAILTQSPENGEKFLREVDSAAVYVNASTRFTDGGQFGLGAEVAISTQKLHARGPLGLEALTSYKWLIRGNYHMRN